MTVTERGRTDADEALATVPPHLREMAARVMAARVHIRPRTRAELNSALFALSRTRRPRLLHYEHDPGQPFQWQLTKAGIEGGSRAPNRD